MGRLVRAALYVLALSSACDPTAASIGPDAGGADARPADARQVDAEPADDAMAADPLADERERLLGTLFGDDAMCTGWNELEASARAVFLTLTHRMFLSEMPNGSRLLDNMTGLHAILGGGESGTACGGIDANRLFLSMNAYAWQRMVDTWDGAPAIGDGGGSRWTHTGDVAGPHQPFDASTETGSGLRCFLLFELPESRPPTAQAHFFLPGAAQPFERGGVSLASDPFMLEIDHDFDCLHQSNPLCPGTDFAQRYEMAYGAYHANWTPRRCPP